MCFYDLDDPFGLFLNIKADLVQLKHLPKAFISNPFTWKSKLNLKWKPWAFLLEDLDDDINIYDGRQVEWAVATRVQPHRDIFITTDKTYGVLLDPSIHPDFRKFPNVHASKIGIDATSKYKGHEFCSLVIDTEEQIKQIEKRWKEYGFK